MDATGPGGQRLHTQRCDRRDSNPHGLPHRILSPARLPVPPRSRRSCASTYVVWLSLGSLGLCRCFAVETARATTRSRLHAEGVAPATRTLRAAAARSFGDRGLFTVTALALHGGRR